MAKMLDITPERLRILAQEGVVPKSGRDRYPVFECNVAYIRYLRERVQTRDDASSSDYHAARLAKVKSEREQIELDMQIKRGDRIPRQDVELACDMIFGGLCGILKANRNKVLSEEQINEIFDQIKALTKKLKGDYGNGSILLSEAA
jgi:hypothetical protein